MNINEEGKYYASMVRKFRTECKSKSKSPLARMAVPIQYITFVSVI